MKNFLICIMLMVLTGCAARPVVDSTKDAAHDRQSRVIEHNVKKIARTGDWLVIRGYHKTDHLVVNATGIPLSHAGIYNAQQLEVIEAEGKGVHSSRLDEFVDKSYRLLVIRPRWRTEFNAQTAWENALALIGKHYDFLGTIGFNYPTRYYCSELAVHAYSPWFRQNEKFPAVIKPGELYLYGTVLYDSLPRDEMEIEN